MNQDKETKMSQTIVDRLNQWRQGEKRPPVKVDAEIGTSCNLNCVYCPQSRSEGQLPAKRWQSLVKEASKLGVQQWNFEGLCEPLSRPKATMKVVKEIKNEGLYGSLTTNGTLWKEEQLQKLVDIGWDRIHFSLDGLPQTHNYLTQVRGSFKRTLDTIQQLNAIKQSQEKSPLISLNFVLNHKNYEELPDLIRICSDLGVSFLFVDPIMPLTERGKALKPKYSEKVGKSIKKSKNQLVKEGMASNILQNYNNLRPELIENTGQMSEVLQKESNRYKGPILGARCLKPWYNLWINHQGGLSYCSGSQIMSDIRKDTLKGFWFGESMEKERTKLKKGKKDFCSHCPPSFVTQREKWRDELAQTDLA